MSRKAEAGGERRMVFEHQFEGRVSSPEDVTDHPAAVSPPTGRRRRRMVFEHQFEGRVSSPEDVTDHPAAVSPPTGRRRRRMVFEHQFEGRVSSPEDVTDHPAAVSPPTGRPYYIPAGQRRRERPPEERRPPMRPVGAPPLGPRPTTRTTTKIVERVSTLRPDDDGGAADQAGAPLAPPPGHGHHGSPPPQHHDRPTSHAPRLPRHHRTWTPTRLEVGKSPVILSPDRRKRRKRPAAFCFTLCCILFWLAVIAVGVAVLTVYLLYRPQPPRLRLTDASLNAGYVDDLTVPGGPPRGLSLNADLTVLAAITSPNTKINVVLWYMELNLFFEGHMIGTQTVRPAPVRESPGGYVLRSVDIVVSEVPISRQDAYAWRNATTQGGPVVLQLAGRFHTQLNFGRWLPYRYWVNPRCTLWLDPPPNGRLRRARC